MREENQNTAVSLRDKIKQSLDFQINSRKEKAKEFSLRRAKQMQDIYTSWLNSTNHWVSQQCTKAYKVGQIAEWIRDYFSKPENWWEDYSNIEDVPLVDNYISLNPDRKAQLYDYVLEDSQICDPTQLYTDMGWISDEQAEEQQSSWNRLANVAWWLTESILWIPKFAWKIWADLAEWSIKMLGGDEERAEEAGNKVKWFIDKIWFWDRESSDYQTTNVVWDIAQLFTPMWAEKARQISGKLISKFPQLAKFVWVTEQALQKYPKLARLIQLGWQWATDVVKYDAINQEYATPEELTAWSLLNIAFGKWGDLINKVWWKAIDTMWIKWIMNTSRAKKAIEAIQKEWWNAKTMEDLAAWFNARWFKWSKEEIVAQLEQRWKDARELKLELLSSSSNKYKSEEATEILKKLQDYYEGSVWQKADYDRISKMLREWDMYTPSELDNIQHELSQSSLNPFKESKIWEIKDAKTSDILGKDYNKVKELIEDIGEKEWLWNIKALNNEIVVANKVKDWVLNKSMSEEIASWLKSIALPTAWAVMWYVVEWDFSGMLKRWAATYWARLLNSTRVRTYISSAVQKLKWAEKVNLTKWLWSNGKQKLTDADSRALSKILEESQWEVRDEIVNILVNATAEWSRKWTVVGWAEIVDSVTWD